MNPSTSTIPQAARAGSEPNKLLPGAPEQYAFRADDPAGIEFDLFRLDCLVDALKGADLTMHREQLARITANLLDLQGPLQ